MTPTAQTKATRVKAATAAVKTLDLRIADLEKRLAALRTRRIDAAAHRDWINAMPESVAGQVDELAASSSLTSQTVKP